MFSFVCFLRIVLACFNRLEYSKCVPPENLLTCMIVVLTAVPIKWYTYIL